MEKYTGTYHPRKVSVYQGDKNGSYTAGNKTQGEYYANVFDLTIEEAN